MVLATGHIHNTDNQNTRSSRYYCNNVNPKTTMLTLIHKVNARKILILPKEQLQAIRIRRNKKLLTLAGGDKW